MLLGIAVDTFEIKKLLYLDTLNPQANMEARDFGLGERTQPTVRCTVENGGASKLKQPRDSRVPRGALKATASGHTLPSYPMPTRRCLHRAAMLL